MEFPLTPPIRSIVELQERPHFLAEESRTNSKISEVVLGRIGEAIQGKKTGLSLSITASRTMTDLLEALAIPAIVEGEKEAMRARFSRNRKRAKYPPWKRGFGRQIPIGLKSSEPYGWINAWIQFLLFLPGIPDCFFFAPRAFDPFREFADQYLLDQEESQPISSAQGINLVQCLLRVLPASVLRLKNGVDFYAVLRAFCSSLTLPPSMELSPERHLVVEENSLKTLDDPLHQHMRQNPAHFLLAIQGEKGSLQQCNVKHCFSYLESSRCYDLDAFVEKRPGDKSTAMFVTYVKVEGSWYQCDDERIISFRSTALKEALKRSFLLHFKRVMM